jgi:SAM domain (Sterile alpha motif)
VGFLKDDMAKHQADKETFTENEIVGEALVALRHDELKELGIASVGHRLTILKSVYDVKVNQDIPIDPDHYIPLCRAPAYPAPLHLLIVLQQLSRASRMRLPPKKTFKDGRGLL